MVHFSSIKESDGSNLASVGRSVSERAEKLPRTMNHTKENEGRRRSSTTVGRDWGKRIVAPVEKTSMNRRRVGLVRSKSVRYQHKKTTRFTAFGKGGMIMMVGKEKEGGGVG